jgi:hypothetical protein
MKTVNSISGGRSSGFMAAHYPADYELFSLVCIDDVTCKPKDKSIVAYVNNKLEKYTERYGEFIATAEDDATLKVLMDLEQYIGKEITWIRGESFDKIINTPSFTGGTPTRLPNRRFRYCTFRMKLLPIFEWWFLTIGEKCQMRIGFRFDEFTRMEKMINNSDPTYFEIPYKTSIRGKKKQRNFKFNWRDISFPLAKNGIVKSTVNKYWDDNGWLGHDDLFNNRRQMEWPIISNCTMCHIHKPEELSVLALTQPLKMAWASSKEKIGKGTWLDSKLTYEQIIQNAENWIPEMARSGSTSCDTGSCTD